ncbi:hypothetical protein ACFW9S_34040 [Streptomyces anulatus]
MLQFDPGVMEITDRSLLSRHDGTVASSFRVLFSHRSRAVVQHR